MTLPLPPEFLALLQRFPELDPGEKEALARQMAHVGELGSFLDEARRVALAEKAREEDTPEGYAAFYELVHGIEPPAHIMDEVRMTYRAHEEGVGVLIFAWRGSWKSTSISETFVAFRIGHEPRKTNVIVGANDDSPEKVTKAIAAIIELHPAWKMVFPHVVPHTERGWSVEGFYVRDTRMEMDEWARVQAAVIDPALVGGGYKSSRLIGKHPSGVLCIDDIHDRDNAASEKERLVVVDILTKTILKTVVKVDDKLDTWLIAVGTPWAEDDAYYTMKGTGNFNFISVPAMVRAREGQPGAVYMDGRNRDGRVFEDIRGWWLLTNPKHFGPASVLFERSQGKAAFWQMIMLDLKTGSSGGLRYYTYDHTKIEPNWLRSGGVDLATLGMNQTKPDPGRDKFAMCIGAKTPMNQLVVEDGVIDQVTQAQAEHHMEVPQKVYRNWRPGLFEGDGAGEQFFMAFYRRNPGIRWIMEKTGGINKRTRQERELGPWLENGWVLISDADTPFLTALRKALDDFPDGNNDIRDALYWLARAFPEVMIGMDRSMSPANKKKNGPGLYTPWAATRS